MLNRALDIIRQHGCIMNKTLARALGIELKRAFYLLQRLVCQGRIAVYPLGMVHAYCVGPPGSIAVTCNDTVVHLDARKIAREVMRRIEQGTRVIRPSRLEPLRPLATCPVLMNVAWNVLHVMLSDSAVVTVMQSRRALVVHNPQAALERLRQVVKSGVLPLEPITPVCKQKKERQKREPVVAVIVYIPEVLIRELDALVMSGAYRSRSAAIREAVKKLLEERKEHA